jgi:hypothetical protein
VCMWDNIVHSKSFTSQVCQCLCIPQMIVCTVGLWCSVCRYWNPECIGWYNKTYFCSHFNIPSMHNTVDVKIYIYKDYRFRPLSVGHHQVIRCTGLDNLRPWSCPFTFSLQIIIIYLLPGCCHVGRFWRGRVWIGRYS